MAVFDPPGKLILMHSPCGVRVELIIGELDTRLELWISPKAKSSLRQEDRNLANRDDALRLYEAIVFPEFNEGILSYCDWDAFYSVVHFGDRALHLMALFDDPGVAFWSDSERLAVDFKSGRDDQIAARSDALFAVTHTEADHTLNFAAASRPGAMHHQIVPEVPGRARYSRALAEAGTPVVVLGEDVTEENYRPTTRALELAGIEPQALLAANEAAIAKALKQGAITLKDDAPLGELTHTSRRLLLACQDKQGAIRTAISRIYYMIWVRDGAITTAFQGHSGWADALAAWSRFLLANPTEIEDPDCPGRTFGQLVGPIAKRQEDGILYAVWTAFAAWSQSGGKDPGADNIAVLADAVDWLERWCFDAEAGLFYRVFACETPMRGSWDNGYDNAVGWVWKGTGHSRGVFWNDKPVTRTYDSYVNLGMVSVYRMMAALTGDAAWLAKADALLQKSEFLIPFDGPAPYGKVIFEDSSTALAGPHDLDREDYAWGHSIPPFGSAQPGIRRARRENIIDLLDQRRDGYFLASYYSVLAAADPIEHAPEEVYRAIREGVETSFTGGGNYPMPMAILEKLGEGPESKWHYIRPQCFSAGPMLAALSGLGVRRLPFGLAVRSGYGLDTIKGFAWRGKTFDFTFADDPAAPLRIEVNGTLLEHTLQIPERFLQEVNRVTVNGRQPSEQGALLIESSLRLLSVQTSDAGIRYEAEAFGQVELVFRNVGESSVRITQDGQAIEADVHCENGQLLVEAQAFGEISIHLT